LIPVRGRVLGLDLGSARIGVALTDTHQRVASGLAMVPRSGDPAADLQALSLLAAQEEAVGVVIGLPLSLDGSVGPAAQAVLDEIERWNVVLGVPVDTVDERFTTVAAQQALRAGDGRRGRGRATKGRQQLVRQRVDSVAATLLLQSWLERRASSESPASGASWAAGSGSR
jgi:putative Holliday junction resolvase